MAGISNCDLQIVSNYRPDCCMPFRVAMFDAKNWDRPCLWMTADSVNAVGAYTHIHYNYANITSDFKFDVSRESDEFKRFKTMELMKRIVSVGGWSFSTTATTAHILQEAFNPDNWDRFGTSIINCLKDPNVDGFNLDYQIPGVSASSLEVWQSK